jgi:hypothetical protein
VEGSEIDVLDGFDLERYRPRALVMEGNSQATLAALDRYLVPRGYRRARSMRWNHFYVRGDEDLRKMRGVTGSVRLANVPHPIDPNFNRVSFPTGPMKFGVDS